MEFEIKNVILSTLVSTIPKILSYTSNKVSTSLIGGKLQDR